MNERKKNDSGGVSDIIDDIATSIQNDVQAVAAIQIRLWEVYRQMVVAQSRRSVTWALIGAGIGLAFFVVAAWHTIWTGRTLEAIIPAALGAVIEAITWMVFFLYDKAGSQMGDFYNRLDRVQRCVLANSMCESLPGEERDKLRSELIRGMALTSSGQVNQSMQS